MLATLEELGTAAEAWTPRTLRGLQAVTAARYARGEIPYTEHKSVNEALAPWVRAWREELRDPDAGKVDDELPADDELIKLALSTLVDDSGRPLLAPAQEEEPK